MTSELVGIVDEGDVVNGDHERRRCRAWHESRGVRHVDLADDVDAVAAVDSFLKTVGDGGLKVLDVSSDATLLPEMERLLP